MPPSSKAVLSTPILLLAAGSSSRLGRPKQLLSFRGGALLRHAAQTAVDAELGPVFVILGAVVDECRETLLGLPVTIVINTAWQEGMGSSIALGARSLDSSVHRAVIIALCDQPGISPGHLCALDDLQRSSGQSIVAACYHDILGPPALFTASHFSQLRNLRGPQGAKALMQRDADVAILDCPEAALDIDTEHDVGMMRTMPSPQLA
jgi:molybdenum cofactor cytidylyltransferase